MKRIVVDLSIVKDLSDLIFTSGYVEDGKGQSIVGYRGNIMSVAITCGNSDSIHFMSTGVSRDVELMALLTDAYHKKGLYIEFSLQGDRDMYAYVYQL